MRNSTSRAFRATAAVAGVAALGASFAGTAAADETTDFGDAFGTSDSEGDSSDFGGGLDSDTLSPSFNEDGLLTFDMPTSDNPLGDSFDSSGYGSSDDDDDYDDSDDSDDCGDHGDDYGDENNEFQNPVQCEGNNYGDGKFGFLGQEFDVEDFHFEESSSYRTADSDTDGPSLFSEDEGTDADQFGDTESSSLDDMMSGDGLSGHEMTVVPLG